MPNSFGLRARTRYLFSQGFRKKGPGTLTKFQTSYRIGDVVDIKANAAFHKGMPHKFYHGKTGVVWNVTRRAIGVTVNKRVGGRIFQKRIHVRVEHAKKSKAHEEFKKRVRANDAAKRQYIAECKAARAEGKPLPPRLRLKRQPEKPSKAKFVRVVSEIKDLAPKPYVHMF